MKPLRGRPAKTLSGTGPSDIEAPRLVGAGLGFPAVRAVRSTTLLLLALACDAAPVPNAPASAAPVPKAAKPDACATGGGELDDSRRAGFFPRTAPGLCIDPHADFRSFGEGDKAPLGAACEALEGDCESYVHFGLRRVLVVPYVSSAHARSRVTVTLLELASPEAAYALFAARILGDSPDDFSAWKRLDPEGTSVRSGATAMAWRASHLALLDYTDETSTPARSAERGGAALEVLARALHERLPGKPDLPASVALLPRREGGPVAIRFSHDDAFGIGGLGSGALARYDDSGKVTPVAVLARQDDDSAKDVLRTLRRIPGSRAPKGAPYESVFVSMREADGEPRVDWLFGRRRNVVLGIGRAAEKLDKAGMERMRHAEMQRLKAFFEGVR